MLDLFKYFTTKHLTYVAEGNPNWVLVWETDLKEQVLMACYDALKSVEVLGLISTGADMHTHRVVWLHAKGTRRHVLYF